MRLNDQEHFCLMITADWMAPFEVAKALFPRGPTLPQRQRVAQALRSLHTHGLLELNSAQNTYRRTEAGNTRAFNEATAS